MISRTPTLAEWPYRMVRLACDLCPRRGQYRKETLAAQFGGAVLMPDVRQPHRAMPAQGCARRGVRGVLLGSAQREIDEWKVGQSLSEVPVDEVDAEEGGDGRVHFE
jgi:hypothetical protein